MSAAGLLVVTVRELHIPRAWIPVIVGAALFVAGVLQWLMARRDPETPSGPPSASR